MDNDWHPSKKTRSGVGFGQQYSSRKHPGLLLPHTEYVKRPKIKKPRHWERCWTQVAHLRVLKWVPIGEPVPLDGSANQAEASTPTSAPVTRSAAAHLSNTERRSLMSTMEEDMSSEVVSEEEDDDLIQTKRRKLESREEDELDEVESPRGINTNPHSTRMKYASTDDIDEDEDDSSNQ